MLTLVSGMKVFRHVSELALVLTEMFKGLRHGFHSWSPEDDGTARAPEFEQIHPLKGLKLFKCGQGRLWRPARRREG